jgi:hypothetical protein
LVHDEVTLRRRRWFTVGVGLELLAVGLIVALFKTPLRTHLLSGAAWFIAVTVLQIGAGAASFAAWSGQRDAIGVTGLAFAIVTAVRVTAFVFVFFLILGLSGLH